MTELRRGAWTSLRSLAGEVAFWTEECLRLTDSVETPGHSSRLLAAVERGRALIVQSEEMLNGLQETAPEPREEQTPLKNRVRM